MGLHQLIGCCTWSRTQPLISSEFFNLAKTNLFFIFNKCCHLTVQLINKNECDGAYGSIPARMAKSQPFCASYYGV